MDESVLDWPVLVPDRYQYLPVRPCPPSPSTRAAAHLLAIFGCRQIAGAGDGAAAEHERELVMANSINLADLKTGNLYKNCAYIWKQYW